MGRTGQFIAILFAISLLIWLVVWVYARNKRQSLRETIDELIQMDNEINFNLGKTNG